MRWTAGRGTTGWGWVGGMVLTAALVPRGASAQACVPAGHGFRAGLAHRTSGALPGRRTTVAEMIRWSSPVTVTDDTSRLGAAAIDAREQQRFTVEGDLWRVSLESDCGLAMEISDARAGSGAPRVVAVIPLERTFQAMRDALVAVLPRARAPARGGRVDLRQPVRVRVTGYGFFNGERWSAAHPRTGGGHGSDAVATLWEVHPVQQFTVVAVAEAPAEGPTGVAVDVGTHPAAPAAEHIRCCDGTVSRECLCDRGDFAGCCVHHGGICGGCTAE